MLNPSQQAAVDHPGGPLLILAGAGSGKTKTLVHRVERILESGIPPKEIFVATFTNKAAGELKSRLAESTGGKAHSIVAGTFHSIAARLIRDFPSMVGLKRGFLILDDDDAKALFKSCLPFRSHGYEKDEIKIAYGLVMGARERDIPCYEWAKKIKKLNTPEYAIALATYPVYEQRLLESNSIDFPGLLLGMRDVAQAREEVQKRYSNLFVDEFQDTNQIQDDIVTLLAKHSNNITVVGDDAQAIYGFRGAERQNILTFPARWPGCRIIKIEENYRSRPEITVLANRILASSTDGYGKVLIPVRSSGGSAVAYTAADEFDEAGRIARKCKDLNSRRGIPYDSQAVLYRTNVQSRVLEHAMNSEGVPYRIVGGLSFWERAEIRDCVAYLRLLHNRHDDLAFKRVLNTPRRQIGESAIKAIEEAANNKKESNPKPGPNDPDILHWIYADAQKDMFDDLTPAASTTIRLSLWDASEKAGLKGVTLARLRAFKRLVDDTAREFAVPRAKVCGPFVESASYLINTEVGQYYLAKALTKILQGVEYAKHLANDPETEEDRQGNIQQLLDLLSGRGEDEQEKTDLAEFLEKAALLQDAAKKTDGDRVTLCTIHGSKGLEWQVVYLPGWEAGIIPSSRGDYEEEKRLAYVAITRARDILFIGWSKIRRKSETSPSVFLMETGLMDGK